MKTVIITGAAGGIGYCLATGFLNNGYNVCGIDIQDIKDDKYNIGSKISFYKADISDERQICDVFEDISHKYTVQVLINNGAVANFHKNIFDITAEEFNNVVDINLNGTFICSKAFIKINQNCSYGRIINIASTRWNQNESGWDAYGASKGGVVSLTSSMAVSLENTGITVNTVSPGWIQTTDYNELTKADHRQHPCGRVGKPEDILNVCLFLADESNSFINAANIVVDGGISKKMIYL